MYTKHRTITDSHNGSDNKQKAITTTEPPPWNGQQPKQLWGLNAFYWDQIFALDSAAVVIGLILCFPEN